jgi:adrenodoxin-NADP+ reductase
MNELQARYDAIVLAYGAELDKALPNVPGANDTEAGVLSARDFVGWYNGLPECQALDARLRQWLATTTSAVVVGAGNVALDVARILLMPRDKLACTDITASALEALQHSKIRHVHIVQRRGPLQVIHQIDMNRNDNYT